VKLSDLTPAAVATIAEDRVIAALKALREQWQREAEWVGRVSFKLAPGGYVRLREPQLVVDDQRDGSYTDLGLTAADLCRYAQTGQGWPDVPADDVAQAEAASDALGVLLGAIDSPHADRHSLPAEWTREAEDDDALAIVARACLARVALARGDDVQRSWLAALTSTSSSRVRTLVYEGVLEAPEVPRGGGGERALSPIKHASAQQWLRARDPSKT
jgi:hypothetical protein